MSPCLWFLVLLQDFSALQTSLLKHNRRLKQRDSLPLNAARGAGGSEVPSMVQGQNSGGGSGARSPSEAEAFGTFVHNNLHFCPMQDFFAGSGGHGPSDPMVNTLVPSPQCSPFPSPLPSPPGKRRIRGSSPEKI